MFPKRFALIGGIVMLALGLVSLIPNLVGTMDGLPRLLNENSYGLFLGLFPMNIFNKVALIVIGLAGIAAANAPYTNLPKSIHYSRLVFFAMAILMVLGMIPQTNTLGGYWPLFGGDVALHGVFGLFGLYFGYALSAKVPDSGPAIKDFRAPMPR